MHHRSRRYPTNHNSAVDTVVPQSTEVIQTVQWSAEVVERCHRAISGSLLTYRGHTRDPRSRQYSTSYGRLVHMAVVRYVEVIVTTSKLARKGAKNDGLN